MKKINKKILILSMSIIFLGHFSATTAFSNYSTINTENLTISQKAELITNLKAEIKKLKLKIKKIIINNKFKKFLTHYSISDNNTVLYTNHKDQINKTNIDLETISILGRDLVKDKDNVYYEGKIWKDADSETFKVIDMTYFQDANSRYAKDKNNVYVDEVIIKEADPKTFRLISTPSMLHNYSMDKNNVYYYEKKLSKEERKWYMDILKKDLEEFKKNIHWKINDAKCQKEAINCVNFKTQKEAQKMFEYCGGTTDDIYRLDGDKDGIACEALPKK